MKLVAWKARSAQFPTLLAVKQAKKKKKKKKRKETENAPKYISPVAGDRFIWESKTIQKRNKFNRKKNALQIRFAVKLLICLASISAPNLRENAITSAGYTIEIGRY